MRVSAFVLVLGAVLLGCAARPQASPAPAAALPAAADTTAADTLVTLERTPCFGTCPSYTLAVLEDGTVRYSGRQFVAHAGYAEKEISPAAVERLVEAFRAADYFALKSSYNAGDECAQLMTDHPTTITSLRLDGQTKRVRHYQGCTGFPAEERLTALEDTIDAIAGTRAWVEGAPGQDNP